MKEAFRPVHFTASSLKVVQQANEILERYGAEGYDLSLRQLYYQFVSQNLLENSEQNYKRLGKIIAAARAAGMIDWDMIKDRGRETLRISSWGSPAEIIDSAAAAFRLDLWANQPAFVLCMVEKQALEGVLEPVCRELRISFSANKGYASASHLYEIGQELRRERSSDKGRSVHVVYLGDHDPSGMDMTRDVKERLEQYSRIPVSVHRIALNIDQIQQYKPPPNPAKTTDSRASGYVARFGRESWELDALSPTVLGNLVRTIVLDLRDEEQWEADLAQEQAMRADLSRMAREYRKGGMAQ